MFTITTIIDTLISIGLLILTKIGSVIGVYYEIKYSFKQHKICPKISNKILLLSASELTRKIRKKEIKCEEVVEAYIKRVKEVNPILNAVVEDRFDLAIQEAKNYDEMLLKSNYCDADLKLKYPLLGVPVTIKESLGVKGMSHSAGQVRLKDYKANRDAEVVTLIKRAGGIILLVSNTPELCTNMETYNHITGVTCNPYDTRRTPAGSSGGEGALLGAGASLIGIGSDMLGSVRVPAAFCGIWGHKPSAGIISVDNHAPTCHDKKLEDVLTVGPLTRYETDLPLILNVILKEDARASVHLDKPINLSGVTVYYSESHIQSSKIEPDIRQALKTALHHLEYQSHCKVKKLTLHKNNLAMNIFFKHLSSVGDLPDLFDDYPNGYFLEILHYIVGKSNLSFNHILLGIMKKLLTSLPDSVIKHCNVQIQEMKDELNQILGDNGVFLLPTHQTGASFHGQYLRKFLDYELTSVFNTVGFPATQCPVGLNNKGLPIGIQVAATTYNDGLCLRVAEEINKLYGGWIQPKFLD